MSYHLSSLHLCSVLSELLAGGGCQVMAKAFYEEKGDSGCKEGS